MHLNSIPQCDCNFLYILQRVYAVRLGILAKSPHAGCLQTAAGRWKNFNRLQDNTAVRSDRGTAKSAFVHNNGLCAVSKGMAGKTLGTYACTFYNDF